MFDRRLTLGLVLIAFPLLFCGCVANRPYRRGVNANPPELELLVEGTPRLEGDCDIDHHLFDPNYHSQDTSFRTPMVGEPRFYMAYIEFDDMGELWAGGDTRGKKGVVPSQLNKALEVIDKAQTQANAPEDKRELVVITFVHGWHNNASQYDETHKNLDSFKAMMQGLSCYYTNKTQNHPILVGIFLSWRGQALTADPAATYWNRRDAATRVGGPSMTEVVTRLMFETKGVPVAPSPDSKSRCEPVEVKGKESSHFAIIAHSFGARALEHAITEPMLSMILERQTQARECAEEYNASNPPPIKPIKEVAFSPPADLIVFLNAANDALEAKETIEALKRAQITVNTKQTGKSQAEPADPNGPFMISITSDGDWATEKIMPLAQWFSSLPLSFRRYDKDKDVFTQEGQLCDHSQRYFYRHSEASIREMRSHLVIQAEDSASCKIKDGKGFVKWPFFKVDSTGLCFCIDRSKDKPTTDKCEEDPAKRKTMFGSEEGWNNTPFYVIGVPKKLIRDHNDIFQDGTVELLTAISTHYEVLLGTPEHGRATMTSPIASKP